MHKNILELHKRKKIRIANNFTVFVSSLIFIRANKTLVSIIPHDHLHNNKYQ